MLEYAKRYYACTRLPVEPIPLGIYDLHSEVGRCLAVHWLRADPSGLVRPLSPSSSLLTPQASTDASGLPGTQDGGFSMDDTIPRDSGIQKVNY